VQEAAPQQGQQGHGQGRACKKQRRSRDNKGTGKGARARSSAAAGTTRARVRARVQEAAPQQGQQGHGQGRACKKQRRSKDRKDTGKGARERLGVVQISVVRHFFPQFLMIPQYFSSVPPFGLIVLSPFSGLSSLKANLRSFHGFAADGCGAAAPAPAPKAAAPKAAAPNAAAAAAAAAGPMARVIERSLTIAHTGDTKRAIATATCHKAPVALKVDTATAMSTPRTNSNRETKTAT